MKIIKNNKPNWKGSNKMKVIEKITLILYSNIMLILAIIACLLIFGWVDMDIVGNVIKNCLTTDPASKITLGVSVVFILLSIRCIFFDPTSKEQLKDKALQKLEIQESWSPIRVKLNNRSALPATSAQAQASEI